MGPAFFWFAVGGSANHNATSESALGGQGNAQPGYPDFIDGRLSKAPEGIHRRAGSSGGHLLRGRLQRRRAGLEQACQLRAQFRRVGMAVDGHGVLHGSIEQFALGVGR